MKTKNFFSVIMTIVALLSFSSCENPLFDQQDKKYSILPENFKIDIPNSLSNNNLKSTSFKSTEIDTVNGNCIYWYLNAFIAVGEGAADIVQAIIWHISAYKIENVISLSYTSNDDNRIKNLDVISDVEFEGRQWQYQLTITDAESEATLTEALECRYSGIKIPLKVLPCLNRITSTVRKMPVQLTPWAVLNILKKVQTTMILI